MDMQSLDMPENTWEDASDVVLIPGTPALARLSKYTECGYHPMVLIGNEQYDLDEPDDCRILHTLMSKHYLYPHAWHQALRALYDATSEELEPGLIFVFGSNTKGRHGRGAALHAMQRYGAVYGEGEGLYGRSYALPTCGYDNKVYPLPLADIQPYVDNFLTFAEERPDLTFFVTRVGCGLAGYDDSDIAPMFVGAPDNCYLPPEWEEFLPKEPPYTFHATWT